MCESRVVFISAGMYTPKKGNYAYKRQHYYLNFGLLGLATILSRYSECRVIHGHFENPDSVVAFAKQFLGEVRGKRRVVFLSIPSYYALPWARDFCASIKSEIPDAFLVVGGQWVIRGEIPWLQEYLTGADSFVQGVGENIILKIFEDAEKGVLNREYTGMAHRNEPFINYDYDRCHDFPDFHISIETSRGCGMGCEFCAEANVALSSLKSPDVIREELHRAFALYRRRGGVLPNVYFEASYFMATFQWAKELATAFDDLPPFKWRVETRVDGILPKTLKLLAQSGLKVVDLGLESASPLQLERMGKTSNVERYLRRASDLLRACNDVGIDPKVNIMLYAGETRETLIETLEWLDQHRTLVKGISSGPVVLYGTGLERQRMLERLNHQGAMPAIGPNTIPGVTNLHLSKEMTFEESIALATAISRQFMTERDYFDLKSFSYFRPSYLYEHFLSDITGCQDEELPFTLTETRAPRCPFTQAVEQVEGLFQRNPLQ